MKTERLISAVKAGEPFYIDEYGQKPVSAVVALKELYELLEEYSPMWYSEKAHYLAKAALRHSAGAH